MHTTTYRSPAGDGDVMHICDECTQAYAAADTWPQYLGVDYCQVQGQVDDDRAYCTAPIHLRTDRVAAAVAERDARSAAITQAVRRSVPLSRRWDMVRLAQQQEGR